MSASRRFFVNSIFSYNRKNGKCYLKKESAHDDLEVDYDFQSGIKAQNTLKFQSLKFKKAFMS